jgi:hypothetical protein
MAVTVTKPKIDRRTDKKRDRTKCYVCVRVENRTANDVKRSVTIYRVRGDANDPLIGCTFEDVEVDRLKTFPGGNEVWGSVEVCCQIECPVGGERFLVAMGTVLDANGSVDIDQADAKKELTVKGG